MPTYFVDHGGSATDPYDTQSKACTTIATLLAAKTLAAGDIVYCCDSSGDGTLGETIAAEIDINGSGTNAGGFIKIIGCNASGSVDGTRYVIDGGANGINIIDAGGNDMLWFENITVQHTGAGTKYGFYNSTGTSSGSVFINCKAHGCAASGWINSWNYSLWYRCVSENNTGKGFGSNDGLCANPKYILCSAVDNGAEGFYYSSYPLYYGCISHGNTDGIATPVYTSAILNCVVDGNTDDGILIGNSTELMVHFVFACRVTNQNGESTDLGLNCAGEPVITGHNYFENNGATPSGANRNISDAGSAPALHYALSLEGGTTTSNVEDQDDTDEGYVSSTNYATDYDAVNPVSVRRVAITIPVV